MRDQISTTPSGCAWYPNLSLRQYFPGRRPEVLWYRLHVRVAPNQSGLALSEWNLTSAFEIYANGEQLFATGQVAPYKPYLFNARLLERSRIRRLRPARW